MHRSNDHYRGFLALGHHHDAWPPSIHLGQSTNVLSNASWGLVLQNKKKLEETTMMKTAMITKIRKQYTTKKRRILKKNHIPHTIHKTQNQSNSGKLGGA